MKMTKKEKELRKKQLEILSNLLQGRKIKRSGASLRWADGKRFPSLVNPLTSADFRADFIEDEVKNKNRPHFGDNLTGFVVISDYGKTYYKYFNKKDGLYRRW